MNLRTLAVGALILLFGASPTYACSTLDTIQGREPSKEEQFAQASAVFVAHVTHVVEIDAKRRSADEPVLEATFRVIEVLKGQPPPDNKVKSYGYRPGNCTVPMFAGMDYVFFLREGAQDFVDWPSGTETFFNINDTKAQALLNQLRALKN
jgi:hypothetical protein